MDTCDSCHCTLLESLSSCCHAASTASNQSDKVQATSDAKDFFHKRFYQADLRQSFGIELNIGVERSDLDHQDPVSKASLA